jgi:hypothetical protein
MEYLLTKFVLTLAVLCCFQPDFNSCSNKPAKKIGNDVSAKELYESLQIPSLSLNIFELAYHGYLKLKEENQINRPEILTIIDYTKSSKEKRLYVIDLNTKKLIYNELVAHGMNTGVDYAKNFSNKQHSNQSSLGFFVTGEPYEGKKGYSLKLYGLEKDFNDLAYARGVVMHGANYVSEKFIRQNGRLGRSFGCTAVTQEVIYEIIQAIKGGSCMFIYYPDKKYLSKSEFVLKSAISSI